MARNFTQLLACLDMAGCEADTPVVVKTSHGFERIKSFGFVKWEGKMALTFNTEPASAPETSSAPKGKAPPDHVFDENGNCKWCPATNRLPSPTTGE